MHRLAIRPVHNAALLKSERLLIKGDGGFDVGDAQGGRNGGIVFLVQRIDLLGHFRALLSGGYSISAGAWDSIRA